MLDLTKSWNTAYFQVAIGLWIFTGVLYLITLMNADKTENEKKVLAPVRSSRIYTGQGFRKLFQISLGYTLIVIVIYLFNTYARPY